MKARYYFMDNLRWVVVLLVLFYHVFYNYNAVGVFGGVGGFAPHQWQDVVCTLLNPWFMTLLFVVAGASSRYALMQRTPTEFRKERVRKLLVPSTLGLLVFGWILGSINSRGMIPSEVPLPIKWLIWAVSGTGHLWFIQDLFIFSLVLLVVRKLIDAERIDRWLTKLPKWGIAVIMIGYGLLLWGTSQSQIDNPSAAQGLLNLYRPVFYLTSYLVGYYVFSSERVHDFLAERAVVLIVAAVVGAIGFGSEFYGKDYTSPEAVQSLWCNLYCWAMTLAMFGAFRRWANGTSPIAEYLSRSSFGVYVVHMTVCTASCVWLQTTALPTWLIYVVALLITYVGSFAAWELLHRIPIVRYCTFGITTPKRPAK